MEVYGINYSCGNRKMKVSMGYCEKCYDANFHDGSSSWHICISRNLSAKEIGDSRVLIPSLKLQNEL
ncbi:MAG: hypothetical protein MUC95_05000 [Spirochaetes bacterium]|jgi:hypothetical protein|nr:hypothetical protein [Spirochaetota bacterium]